MPVGAEASKIDGHACLILDGPLIPTEQVAADRPSYSGGHRNHGMAVQAMTTLDGDVVWVSGASPGSVPDTTAAWIWQMMAELEQRIDRAGGQGLRRCRRPAHSVQGAPRRRWERRPDAGSGRYRRGAGFDSPGIGSRTATSSSDPTSNRSPPVEWSRRAGTTHRS
ncbi:transposase family protein [Nocardia gipuzkoensis]